MITIDPTYNGPTGVGHGGVSAGRFAELVDPLAASVRLSAPIPLATDLGPTPGDGGAVELRAGDRLIATASPLHEPLDVALFAPLEIEAIAAAEARSAFGPGHHHPYPLCFGCGNARTDNAALELFTGPIAGSDDFAVRWTPSGAGPVPPWLIWGALDCPTAAPAFGTLEEGSMALTGTLAVEIRGAVGAGVEYQIHSRLVDVDGRKVRTEGALVAPGGANVAVVASTWIVVDADVGTGE